MSNVIQFRPADRTKLWARLCLYGLGGAGKTYTMLQALFVLAEIERTRRGDTGPVRVAIIDTEKGRSRKYHRLNGWHWDCIEPTSYDPAHLTKILAVAAQEGYHAVGIDGGSPYWDGRDGMQEQVDRITSSSNSRNSFGTGWKDMNPVERAMWDAVTGFPGHVVMTLRVKAEYVMQDKVKDGRTFTEPKKIGMRPRQRDGFDYEFDVVGSMDLDHTLTVVKSDLQVIPVGSEWEKPGPEFAQLIGDFCTEGVDAVGPLQFRTRALAADLTVASAKELFDEVQAAGHEQTPVLDEMDEVVTLGALIRNRAAAIKAADDAAAREAARQAAMAQGQATRAAANATPVSKAQRLADAVEALLTAADVDEAGKREARAVKSPLVNEDISGLLGDRDRDELSIAAKEVVTLGQLAALMCTYVGSNKQPVRKAAAAGEPTLTDQNGSQVPRSEVEQFVREAKEIAREALAS